MNKQEVIRKAYGEFWDKFKDSIGQDGWTHLSNVDFYPEIDWHTKKPQLWRPKSLQGIENNNGWIKIESEADLPKESGDYWVLTDNNSIIQACYYNTTKDFWSHNSEWKVKVTHYQPITKPLKPIY